MFGMKYFKSEIGRVCAFSEHDIGVVRLIESLEIAAQSTDKSEVEYAASQLEKIDRIFFQIRDRLKELHEMTTAEVEAHINPPQSLQDLAATVQRKVDTEYTRRMSALANNYPAHERESWPVQLAEAQALQADENAATPWMDQCATVRGLTRQELAARILSKDAAYRQVSGSLTGIRQWHEDQIAALLNAGEASRQALQAYDTTQGWPTTDLREPQPA